MIFLTGEAKYFKNDLNYDPELLSVKTHRRSADSASTLQFCIRNNPMKVQFSFPVVCISFLYFAAHCQQRVPHVSPLNLSSFSPDVGAALKNETIFSSKPLQIIPTRTKHNSQEQSVRQKTRSTNDELLSSSDKSLPAEIRFQRLHWYKDLCNETSLNQQTSVSGVWWSEFPVGLGQFGSTLMCPSRNHFMSFRSLRSSDLDTSNVVQLQPD